ncbi:hypothetical protein [Cellulosimicrobium arenosum]|uniref:DoxX family protein n=1 Tax=Cellulosimicrobium arenosum TaxID=2708133 RepID=A0A927G7X3_9MICO|nr:hypothetical protein [Cellulosimicrobium arenosum]MBD8078523.1 hypothetical protein [Cellulosimicrobium arenosum]
MAHTTERQAPTPLPDAGDTRPETAGLTERANRPTQVVLGVLRMMLGFTFLWAFLDKTFGLGFATPSEGAWIHGGSPTTGFLSHVDGPFAGLFTGIAGAAWADWLFMAGLLGIGLALMLGIAMRIAAVAGPALLVLMYLAELPLENNPVVDDHLTSALTIIALTLLGAGSAIGLGKTWRRLPVVRRNTWLV